MFVPDLQSAYVVGPSKDSKGPVRRERGKRHAHRGQRGVRGRKGEREDERGRWREGHAQRPERSER